MSTEPWQDSVPAGLLEAIRPLRDSFDEAHSECGRVTRLFGYAELHKEVAEDQSKEHLKYLLHMQATVGSAALTLFKEGMKLGSEASVFKAFYDLYLEGTLVQALRILTDLTEIGIANNGLIATSPLSWAQSQTNSTIRHEAHAVRLWVQGVCDKQPHDPDDSWKELLYWRKWQAPSFLVMKPNGNREWNAASAWERNDPATSIRWLDHFEDQYVQHLEAGVQQAMGRRAVELAKEVKPTAPSTASSLSASARHSRGKAKPKLLSPLERLRRSVIFGAIQGGSTGRAYCKDLDNRKLPIAPSWISEGCPATYSAAYVAGATWQRKILDEKTRYTRKYNLAAPSEREKLVQHGGDTRRTRQ